MFELSPEQKQLQKLAFEFARDVVRPKAPHHDETGEWPAGILKEAWELGLVNIHIPERCGGLGLGAMEGVLIDEELGWGCTGMRITPRAATAAPKCPPCRARRCRC
jgi:acyl-CoA dehydrogenase